MAVLEQLVAEARKRSRNLPTVAGSRPRRVSFHDAIIGKQDVSVIAEFKRRSPSENAIADDCDLAQQLALYEAGGAAGVSILTEPSRFGGSFDDLRAAASSTELPLLMKDFVVSAAQVTLGARLGASACLLIVRCLDATELQELAHVAVEEGLTPLVECHEAEEVHLAATVEGAVIGINNRNLDDLSIDRTHGESLLELVSQDRVTIAESGYDTPAQVRALRGRADAALIGTALMRHANPRRFLEEVRG